MCQNLPTLFPGVDDVFVFINTYRQATHLKDLRLRMIHTIQTAGKATFFTSLTTAAAYAANIFSQVHHSFGIRAFLFLPEALIEMEAASTILLPSRPARGHAGLACPRGLSLYVP